MAAALGPLPPISDPHAPGTVIAASVAADAPPAAPPTLKTHGCACPSALTWRHTVPPTVNNLTTHVPTGRRVRGVRFHLHTHVPWGTRGGWGHRGGQLGWGWARRLLCVYRTPERAGSEGGEQTPLGAPRTPEVGSTEDHLPAAEVQVQEQVEDQQGLEHRHLKGHRGGRRAAAPTAASSWEGHREDTP